jgi:transposase
VPVKFREELVLVEAKRTLGIPLHERPPNSPDLNPIENVWRVMKERIKARDVFLSTLQEMKTAVQEEWDRLKPEEWNKYIDSMPERIRQVKQRKGMQTEY